jgi:hypothetical protein
MEIRKLLCHVGLNRQPFLFLHFLNYKELLRPWMFIPLRITWLLTPAGNTFSRKGRRGVRLPGPVPANPEVRFRLRASAPKNSLPPFRQ